MEGLEYRYSYIPLPGIPSPAELADMLREPEGSPDVDSRFPGIPTPRHMDSLLGSIVGVPRISRATEYAINRMMKDGPEAADSSSEGTAPLN